MLTSTWLNSFVSIIGIIVTIIGIVVPFVPITTFFEHKWQAVVGIESIVIFFLIIAIKKSKVIFFSLNFLRIYNKSVYSKFVKRESSMIEKRIRQISAGFLKLHGEEVQRIQSEFFDFLDPRNDKEKFVLATDVTLHPEILITRTAYHQSNTRFISAGGVIKRLFILPDKLMFSESFINNFLQVLKINKIMSVQIGIIPISLVKSEHICDFIIYGNAAVLIEDMQADPVYKIGRSELRFLSSDIATYEKQFNILWNNYPFTAIEIAEKYLGYINNYKTNTIDTAKNFFSELKKIK